MAQCWKPFNVKRKNLDMHGQNLMQSVPCGKCIPCKKRRSSNWSFRLTEEAKVSSSACFLTLTYETPPTTKMGFHTLKKRDFQTFLKRLRKLVPVKMVDNKNVNKLKYYACGEYGTQTHRPHYHAVIFNLPHSIIANPQQISDTWKNGHIHIANNNIKTINYVVGYMQKGNFTRLNTFDDRLPEFSLMSKGMGNAYLTPQMIQYYRSRKLFCITKQGGDIISMPRYYKNIIYTDKELKELYNIWLEEYNHNFLEMSETHEAERNKVEHHKALQLKHEKHYKLNRIAL